MLVLAGHDPSGGAGIQADIETIHSLGGHALTAITALTLQDSRGVYAFQSVSADWLRRQADILLADFQPAAVKIGMIAEASLVPVIVDIVRQLPDVPVVYDPVLAGNLHGSLIHPGFCEALPPLLQCTTLLTPNVPELQILLKDQPLTSLFAQGIRYLLCKGGHQPGALIVNELFDRNGCLYQQTTPRLAAEFHGSGCTLAAACAIHLAQGQPMPVAVANALQFTTACLNSAFTPGHGQKFPRRS